MAVSGLKLKVGGRFGYRDVEVFKNETTSLGKGSYGIVYKARCGQLPCAAKLLHRVAPSCHTIERLDKESRFLTKMRHPNLIQYLGACHDPDSRQPIVFMELMDESLTHFLGRPENRLSLPFHLQVNIALDVAQALAYIHFHDIVHCNLSSNNVLLLGSIRAKVTDFGMARLTGNLPHPTSAIFPGSRGYMAPEALREPPSYTCHVDVFSCGVLHIQLLTRKFPNPGPWTEAMQLQDPHYGSKTIFLEVPELERRKAHLDLIDPTHPLLEAALDCLKEKEERPSAEQLCSRLAALQDTHHYQESLQQAPGQTSPQSHHVEIEKSQKQVREAERELYQLKPLSSKQEEPMPHKVGKAIQKSKNAPWIKKHGYGRPEGNQLATTLMENLEEKHTVTLQMVSALQEKERQIKYMQNRVRKFEDKQGMRGGCERTRNAFSQRFQLGWRDGPSPPDLFHGYSVAASGGVVYFCHQVANTAIFMFTIATEKWAVIQCPKTNPSIALVNGLLTAIGGQESSVSTKTLLSYSTDREEVGKWSEVFPPMEYTHTCASVSCTNTYLIVVGSWFMDARSSMVEVMNLTTLCWSTVASIPYHAWNEAWATVLDGQLYVGGGVANMKWTTQVLTCAVGALIKSKVTQNHLRIWKHIAELPVTMASLITFQGQLLALGGVKSTKFSPETTEIQRYNRENNSWEVIGHMKTMRSRFFAVPLSDYQFLVAGGRNLPGRKSLEIAAVV